MSEPEKLKAPASKLALYAFLLLASFIINLLCLQSCDGDTYTVLAILFNLLALVSGAYYSLVGYRKEGHMFYKSYLGFYGMNVLCAIASLSLMDGKILLLFLKVFIFGGLCALLAMMNPGRKRSCIYATFISILEIINLVIVIFSGAPGYVLYGSVASLLLSLLFDLIVCFKYLDKLKRHKEI